MFVDPIVNKALWPEDRLIDQRVIYWTQGHSARNFGDYLTQYIYRQALVAPIADVELYRLLGSAVDEFIIRDDLRALPPGSSIAFWCCGMREHRPLPEDLRRQCHFFGVRGPMTRDGLGLPQGTAIGDPGLLVPLLWSPRESPRTRGKTVCMPHFSERHACEALRASVGADVALTPAIRSEAELLALFDDIASADFVLTGSLHGAIIACAYGRPFAFLDSGLIDIPFKWHDFAGSIGIPARFVRTVSDGKQSCAEYQGAIKIPLLSRILGCSPFSVKPEILVRALRHDVQHSNLSAAEQLGPELERRASLLDSNSARFAEALRDASAERHARHSRLAETVDVAERAVHRLGEAVDGLRDQVLSHSSGASLRFERPSAVLSFVEGGNGLRYLAEGWTTPLPDYGPWTLLPSARIVIPRHSGWQDAVELVLEGLLFAPHVGARPGQRHVTVWLNDAIGFDQTLHNGDADHQAVPHGLRVDLRRARHAADGDLAITLTFDDVGSNKQLGLNAYDDRKIGFALNWAVFAFERQSR